MVGQIELTAGRGYATTGVVHDAMLGMVGWLFCKRPVALFVALAYCLRSQWETAATFCNILTQ